MAVLCLLCGSSEDEVQKMHYFPNNSEKCKLWSESIGIKYIGLSMRNYRICSNHFNKSDYTDCLFWKLKPNAMPNRFLKPKLEDLSSEENIDTTCFNDKASSRGGTVCLIRGCQIKTGGGVAMFRIPQNQERAITWLQACKREDLIQNTSLSVFKICELHFDRKFISEPGVRKRVFDNAIPTIFPWTEIPEKSTENEYQKEENISTFLYTSETEPCTSTTSILESDDSLSAELERITDNSSSSNYPPFTSSTQTQTSSRLTCDTPRKNKLRLKIRQLRNQLGHIKLMNQTKCKWSLKDFTKMCDVYLDKSFAQIVKAHAVSRSKKV